LKQPLAVASIYIDVDRAEERPRRRVAIKLGKNVVFREPRAAEDLSSVVGCAPRRRPQEFGSQRFAEASPFLAGGGKVVWRKRVRECFQQITACRQLSDHFLDCAEFANRVSRLFIMEQTGELDSTRRVADCSVAKFGGHSGGDGNQVGTAQYRPDTIGTVDIHRIACLEGTDSLQSQVSEAGAAQSKRFKIFQPYTGGVSRYNRQLLSPEDKRCLCVTAGAEEGLAIQAPCPRGARPGKGETGPLLAICPAFARICNEIRTAAQ